LESIAAILTQAFTINDLLKTVLLIIFTITFTSAYRSRPEQLKLIYRRDFPPARSHETQ
jgi:hypothetical protein